MKEDLEPLLGGYAYDLLEDEDEQRLLRSALDDQSLFDELAGEEELRDLLADPESRSQVLEELRRPASAKVLPWRATGGGGWRTLAALAATLVVALGLLWQLREPGEVDPAPPPPPPEHGSRGFEVAPPVPAAGDLRLVLRVTDTGGAPLDGADVAIEGTAEDAGFLLQARTDAHGLYDSEGTVAGLRPGRYRALASKDGYEPFDGAVEVKEGGEPGVAVLSFRLQAR